MTERMPEVGDLWVRRDDSSATVVITEIRGDRIFVDRNTSRRTQPILLATLRRTYRFVRSVADAGDIVAGEPR